MPSDVLSRESYIFFSLCNPCWKGNCRLLHEFWKKNGTLRSKTLTQPFEKISACQAWKGFCWHQAGRVTLKLPFMARALASVSVNLIKLLTQYFLFFKSYLLWVLSVLDPTQTEGFKRKCSSYSSSRPKTYTSWTLFEGFSKSHFNVK